MYAKRKDTSSIIDSTTKITSKSQNGRTVVSAHLLHLTLSCLAEGKKKKKRESTKFGQWPMHALMHYYRSTNLVCQLWDTTNRKLSSLNYLIKEIVIEFLKHISRPTKKKNEVNQIRLVPNTLFYVDFIAYLTWEICTLLHFLFDLSTRLFTFS